MYLHYARQKDYPRQRPAQLSSLFATLNPFPLCPLRALWLLLFALRRA